MDDSGAVISVRGLVKRIGKFRLARTFYRSYIAIMRRGRSAVSVKISISQ
ncbi:MAG TPA: hypothetical protein VHQ23_18350 [Ilumatobacteraceae bacterium]|jgi:hypothetical protein|nr:hypothetical protein [Ilumatobacteraceae bacterium]